MHRRTLLLTLLALALGVSGCRSRHRISVGELERLNGFRQGDVVPLVTAEGRTIRFTSGSYLMLVLEGAPAVYGRFLQIHFDGVEFVGDTGDLQVRVGADEIVEGIVWHSRYSPGLKALGAVALWGVVLFTSLVTLTIIYVAIQISRG